MKIEAVLTERAHDEKTVEIAASVSAVRVVLTPPKEVADPKRVTMGSGCITFRSKG